jgi:hypothetical protein
MRDLPCADRRIPQTLFHPLEIAFGCIEGVGRELPPAYQLGPDQLGSFATSLDALSAEACHQGRNGGYIIAPSLAKLELSSLVQRYEVFRGVNMCAYQQSCSSAPVHGLTRRQRCRGSHVFGDFCRLELQLVFDD